MMNILMTTSNSSKLFGRNVELLTPEIEDEDIATPANLYYIQELRMYVPENMVSEVITTDDFPDDLNTTKYVYVKDEGFVIDENWEEPENEELDEYSNIPSDIKDLVVEEIKQEVLKDAD